MQEGNVKTDKPAHLGAGLQSQIQQSYIRVEMISFERITCGRNAKTDTPAHLSASLHSNNNRATYAWKQFLSSASHAEDMPRPNKVMQKEFPSPINQHTSAPVYSVKTAELHTCGNDFFRSHHMWKKCSYRNTSTSQWPSTESIGQSYIGV